MIFHKIGFVLQKKVHSHKDTKTRRILTAELAENAEINVNHEWTRIDTKNFITEEDAEKNISHEGTKKKGNQGNRLSGSGYQKNRISGGRIIYDIRYTICNE